MFDLKIQDIKKSFWLKATNKIAFCIRPTSPLDSIPVSLFLKTYIHHLDSFLPKKLQVDNLRGRPFESFPETSLIPASNKDIREEEIFFSEGRVLEPNDSENREKDSSFTFSLRSNFNEYTPTGNISHNVEPLSTGKVHFLEKHITPNALVRWLPLELDCFRFGIEQYKKKFLGSMAGLVPTINSRFYIEVSEKEIFVLVEQSDQKRKKFIPLQNHAAVVGLEETLSKTMQFSNLREKINEQR